MFYLFESDFLGLIPETFLLLGLSILLGYGVWYEKGRESQMTSHQLWIGSLCLVYTLILLCQSPLIDMILCFNTLVIDGMSAFLKSLIIISTLCIFGLSFSYLPQERIKAFEVVILFLLGTLSLMLMVSSYDFISLYLAIEFQSLGFYVLAALKRDNEYSTEAGLKYFVLGAFSSGFYLFGASLIYGLTGTTNFEDLSILFTGVGPTDIFTQGSILVGLLFLSVAFLFKISAAPFHMWSPDVYEGAPTTVTAFFSIAPKLALFGVLVRVFYLGFFDFLFSWQQIFFICSLASMILGAFGALGQLKIKRLLAFSSIGHVGYLLIGLATGSLQGLQGIFLYLFVYLVMTINAFGVVLSLRTQEGEPRFLSDLKNLSLVSPILALTFSVNLFSMAGIPPLAGFLSKFYLFFAALDASLYSLAILGVLSSVLSCFYYISIIKLMYFHKADEVALKPILPIDGQKGLILGITFFGVLFIFLYPSPFFLLSHAAALSFS
uniref:NADH dehydrogenase subunit 2 n=1 Tax=Chloropicon sieburthii TaxID=1764286 RepID=A0A4D6C4K2_9CHLO|nr:NADH dehydrogenase subunit 2 [Chloropicon sieburthii]QBX98632.1 NADH dehydrogenase subunit 2 [Chloropicon sieburthii]